MKWQVIKIRVLQWLKRIVFYSLYTLLVFFIVGFSVLQIPAVQKALVSRITDNFSKISGFKIEFDRFYFLWYDRLEITNLEITDPQQNTLIEAGRLFINFRLSTLLKQNNINIDAVSLQGGYVNLVMLPVNDSTRELNIDLLIAEIGKATSSGKGGGGPGPKINIGEVLIEASGFSYNRPEKDSIAGFDYNHFNVALDQGNLDNFKVVGDTIEFNLGSLLVKDHKTQLTIKEFSTFFRISQGGMEFYDLNLHANKSYVSDTIVLTFDGQRQLSDFNRLVNIDARLKNTMLYPQDLNLFTKGVEKWKEPLSLDGHIKGRVNHFTFYPMRISVGSSTIVGRLQMDGLPVIDETFIAAKLKTSIVYTKDLEFLLPDIANRNISPFRKIQLDGNFTGFINDFVANGNFETSFGHIQSDINYKILQDNIGLSSYKGQLTLTDFDLGKFLGDTVNFQKVNLSGRINGKGFRKATADFTLIGEIPSIGLRGYKYVNIKSDARFTNQFFQGNLAIDDPNLQFSMAGSIDLRHGRDLINIEARLDTALLHELHLTREEVFLQSYLDIDSRGLQLDSISGSALFKNTLVQFRDETIRFDSVHLIAENENGYRDLLLRSSMADFSLKGDFYYSTLFKDIQKIIHEFVLNIRNDPEAIKAYYLAKPKTEQTYKAIITADIHDANPLFQVLDLDLHASPGTHIQGEFSNSTTSILQVYSYIDSLMVGGQIFSKNEIEFHGSKVRDSTQVLAQLSVNSKQQIFNAQVTTKNLFMEGIWNKDHIDLGLDVDQQGYDNSLRIRSEIDFLPDSTKIKILPSQVRILGKDWKVNPSNYTVFMGKEWHIHHLGFSQDRQHIDIHGLLSKDPEQELKVDVQNFDLSLLNLFSREKFKGLLNAEITQRDVYQNVYIEDVLTIDSLTINNFLVGDVRGINTRDPGSKHFNIDITIDRLKKRIVDIKGYYDPRDSESPLHTKAILEKANLILIEPVVRDLFSQLDGTVTGVFDITGTFLKPTINGQANIEQGQLMINYLKTLYKVTGTVGINSQQIQFSNFVLTDGLKNQGRLQGYIAHRHFREMHINLDASFTNFHLLSTTLNDNSLFYGQAFGTGTLSILGPISNLKISATARTNKNTRLSIPVGTTASEEKKDFIQFTSFTQTAKKKTSKTAAKKRELTGLTLELNIDVTPDAYAEIIFDIKSGDIIRGRGRGDILLQIDTKGDFNMIGVMEFTEGAYNFTLYDIINKEFNIKPGSRITWFGDPYAGNLNIVASYKQNTGMGPVIQDKSVVNDPNLRRKYPVEVMLKLDGPMMSPQINFDLDAKDLPNNIMTSTGKSVSLKIDFDAFKAKLDEQELKRQVFSLIVLRKLSPLDAFETSGSLYNSVSELLSNQLSYWLSQVDQNLEIDLDLGTLDQEAFNTFQLRLSYSFLNGRLRVTRDGSFGNQANVSQVSTIAGDWTVDYLLTPDGRFKVKMYSRTNVNQLQSTLNTQTAAITTGASFLYTENFNEFSELMKSSRDKRRRELEKSPPEINDENN